MKRRTRWGVETLEGKVLLSGLNVISADVSRPRAGHHHVTAPAAPAESGLAVKLSTDKAVYKAGQTAVLELTETNVSDQTIDVTQGPSIGAFSVTRGNGATVWKSNSGIEAMFVTEHALAPGQSQTITAMWTVKGQGAFQVHNALTPGTEASTIHVKAR